MKAIRYSRVIKYQYNDAGGDVVIVDFPFTSGGSKIRPALIVQNDLDNTRLPKTIVAMISGNIKRQSGHEATHWSG